MSMGIKLDLIQCKDVGSAAAVQSHLLSEMETPHIWQELGDGAI